MLFYYLCTLGEERYRTAYPTGAQSKDADVYKWVTMHSGSPAVCQQEHPGAHLWRPDEGGDEERVGEKFDSPWGPSLVIERAEDPVTGTYLLLRIFPHGYKGKAGETGIERKDVPKEFAGKV